MAKLPAARLAAVGLISAAVVVLCAWQLAGMHSPLGHHPAGPADCVIRLSSPQTPYCP